MIYFLNYDMSVVIWKDYFLSKFRHYLYSSLYSTNLIGDDLSEINENLYLSGIESAYNLELLKKHQITHVINTVSWLDPAFQDQFEYLNLNLRDVPEENIKDILEDCNKFIENAIENGGKVLVHCVYGVSRSSSIVISYVMHKYSISYQEAYELVKSKRPIISPNSGFTKQLNMV